MCSLNFYLYILKTIAWIKMGNISITLLPLCIQLFFPEVTTILIFIIINYVCSWTLYKWNNKLSFLLVFFNIVLVRFLLVVCISSLLLCGLSYEYTINCFSNFLLMGIWVVPHFFTIVKKLLSIFCKSLVNTALSSHRCVPRSEIAGS